jgi:Holliday junction DNA helicase RuvA
MIGHLSGKYLAAEDNNIIVDVGGVGYSVLVSSRTVSGLMPGSAVELFIHTNLRENALELFGFSSLWEKKVFQLLTSVSGVGPRTAINILNGLDGETILSSIVREDRATLGSVSGVGKKTAERLIVELSDKARKLLTERPRSGLSSGTASCLEPSRR